MGAKVVYRSARGFMLFEKKKPIFQNRMSNVKLNVGLGVVVAGSLYDKEDYAFAEINNIISVIPDCYYTPEYFENVGVPFKVSKGVYGDSVFLKEEYLKKSYIKALDKDGNVLLQESKRVKNNSLNTYYTRLDNAVGDWEDITDSVRSGVLDSIMEKECELNINNLYILSSLSRLVQNSVVKTVNGVIFAKGTHESLAIWGNGNKASMAWIGQTPENIGITEDITEEVKRLLAENDLV